MSTINKIKVGILLGGVAVAGCIFTGCFSSNHEQLNQPSAQLISSNTTKSYDILTDDWNRAVNNLDLSSKYRIDNREDIDGIATKLNIILNGTNHSKEFKSKNQCQLNYTKSDIYLPTKMYFEYLKQNEFKYKLNLTKDTLEDDMIKELKKITNSKYISSDMLKKIATLDDFKYYFNEHKKEFVNNGFSKYIKNFDMYEKAVKKCK
jgi:hypothetical protein